MEQPNVSQLLLEAEHIRLQRELAQRRLASARQRAGLRGAKLEAAMAEVELLAASRDAQNCLKGRIDKPHCQLGCPHQSALVDDFQSSSKECRGWIAEALLSFANSWDVGRLTQEEIDYRLVAVDHAMALDGSEIALAQWENLIGVPISQLVAFHGTGIKADQIGNLIQALGLGSIAAGVN